MSVEEQQLVPEWEEFEGPDGQPNKRVSKAWVERVFTGMELERLEPIVGEGGFVGELYRLVLRGPGDEQEQRWVVKQISSAGKARISLQMGLAREAHFYNAAERLAPGLCKAGNLPRVHYAHADDSSGERVVIMEDLGAGTQLGFLFGPINPNNWPKADSGQLAEIMAAQAASEPQWPLHNICELVFRTAARLHAANWNAPSLLDGPAWLRGASWWRADASAAARSQWEQLQSMCSSSWADAKRTGVLDNAELFPVELVQLVDASLARISFDEFARRAASQPFTLVHGDFHPGNMMWMPDQQSPSDGRVKLLDWEMVGVGSGPQELGQFLLSHAEPEFRRAHDRKLVRAYYDELMAARPDIDYSFDQCWLEYAVGGLARFLWFCAWGAKFWSPKMCSFFCRQTLEFAADYAITVDNVPQPRC